MSTAPKATCWSRAPLLPKSAGPTSRAGMIRRTDTARPPWPASRAEPAMAAAKPTVLGLAADLAAGRTTSRALGDDALARIADPGGEGVRTFTKVYGDEARAVADAQDRLRQAGYVASPLAGLPISIKDLFDVAGEVTLAGSTALDDQPPAPHDAPIVARLRA